MELDYAKIGLKAGLETHQQLDTKTKLFCKCPTSLRDKKESRYSFTRYLRASKGEIGEVDRAAREEAKYRRAFLYRGYDSTCLLENDEEPPGEFNNEAIEISLKVALLLQMNPIDEIHVMRKMVVDGSNTSGFQRTALIATDGMLTTDEGIVKVDSLCLEEDAAQKIETEGNALVYSLDRLGIPLVEICTAPDIRTPEQAIRVAEQIGMILRSTGRVKRGLGTIRQDINISIDAGARVEIKGVQDLKMIGEIVKNEVNRQLQLIALKDELNKRGAGVDHQIKYLSDIGIFGACLRGFSGILGREIQPGTRRRFSSELADYASKYGIDLMHTDELHTSGNLDGGITEEKVEQLRKAFGATDDDTVVIVAASADRERAENALNAVLERAEYALREIPVPEETRRGLPDGSSAYMRPLPGAARMYPETDVTPVEIDESRLSQIKINLPETFEHRKVRYMEEFGLNTELADKIARSPNFSLFEEIMGLYADRDRGISATLVVRTLTDMVDEVQVPLEDRHFIVIFEQLSAGAFGKEALPEILKFLAKKPEMGLAEAIEELGLSANMDAVEKVIEDIVNSKREFIREKGAARAVGPLMGVVMKELRGKVDGKVILRIVEEKLKRV